MALEVLVHQEDIEMARISMDLELDPRDTVERRGLKNPTNRAAMTEGCVEVLRQLGNLAHAVEAFRVTFKDDKNPDLILSAEITIHISDPLGIKTWHSKRLEWRVDQGSPDYRVIASLILRDDFLVRTIQDHLERGRAKLRYARKEFARLK